MRFFTSKKGISLIEVIVVFTIISILLLVSMRPGMDNFSLKTKAKDLCWEIRRLRSLAMSEDTEYEVVIDFDEGKECYYYVLQEAATGTEHESADFDKDFSLYYDSSGEFKQIDSANNVTIKFGIDGRPNEGWIIRIKNDDIDSYIDIDIDAISGGVQIIDED